MENRFIDADDDEVLKPAQHHIKTGSDKGGTVIIKTWDDLPPEYRVLRRGGKFWANFAALMRGEK